MPLGKSASNDEKPAGFTHAHDDALNTAENGSHRFRSRLAEIATELRHPDCRSLPAPSPVSGSASPAYSPSSPTSAVSTRPLGVASPPRQANGPLSVDYETSDSDGEGESEAEDREMSEDGEMSGEDCESLQDSGEEDDEMSDGEHESELDGEHSECSSHVDSMAASDEDAVLSDDDDSVASEDGSVSDEDSHSCYGDRTCQTCSADIDYKEGSDEECDSEAEDDEEMSGSDMDEMAEKGACELVEHEAEHKVDVADSSPVVPITASETEPAATEIKVTGGTDKIAWLEGLAKAKKAAREGLRDTGESDALFTCVVDTQSQSTLLQSSLRSHPRTVKPIPALGHVAPHRLHPTLHRTVRSLRQLLTDHSSARGRRTKRRDTTPPTPRPRSKCSRLTIPISRRKTQGFSVTTTLPDRSDSSRWAPSSAVSAPLRDLCSSPTRLAGVRAR